MRIIEKRELRNVFMFLENKLKDKDKEIIWEKLREMEDRFKRYNFI